MSSEIDISELVSQYREEYLKAVEMIRKMREEFIFQKSRFECIKLPAHRIDMILEASEEYEE